jgi:hypothetical protein
MWIAARIRASTYKQPIGPILLGLLSILMILGFPSHYQLLPTNRNEIPTTGQPYKVTRSIVQWEIITLEERYLVPGDLVLHTAL